MYVHTYVHHRELQVAISWKRFECR